MGDRPRRPQGGKAGEETARPTTPACRATLPLRRPCTGLLSRFLGCARLLRTAPSAVCAPPIAIAFMSCCKLAVRVEPADFSLVFEMLCVHTCATTVGCFCEPQRHLCAPSLSCNLANVPWRANSCAILVHDIGSAAPARQSERLVVLPMICCGLGTASCSVRHVADKHGTVEALA